jgi:hypothetical protein
MVQDYSKVDRRDWRWGILRLACCTLRHIPLIMSKLSKWDGWVLVARLTLLHVAGATNHLHT